MSENEEYMAKTFFLGPQQVSCLARFAERHPILQGSFKQHQKIDKGQHTQRRHVLHTNSATFLPSVAFFFALMTRREGRWTRKFGIHHSLVWVTEEKNTSTLSFNSLTAFIFFYFFPHMWCIHKVEWFYFCTMCEYSFLITLFIRSNDSSHMVLKQFNPM